MLRTARNVNLRVTEDAGERPAYELAARDRPIDLSVSRVATRAPRLPVRTLVLLQLNVRA